MAYLVTGATGFIGKRLVRRLLTRTGHVHVIVRDASPERTTALLRYWQTDETRISFLAGDITSPR
ncbi:MAG: SDR family oxidoreductase, partial [Pseudomonadota bacterium]